ncbi:MAG: Ig-like domain-containing protein [Gemmatimonadales bacterium]
MSRPTLPALAAALLAAAACGDGGPPGVATLRVAPILDSLFPGDTLTPPFSVTYTDANGNQQPTGPVRWRSSAPAVAGVDSITGALVAAAAGEATITATANGVTGRALIVVTGPLEVTLLLDTIYLMPGDTLTVPVALVARSGPPPPLRFSAPSQAVFAIDSLTGRVTATAPGGPFRFVVRADSVADTGAVDVRVLGDTLGGRAYYAFSGTLTRRQDAPVRAVNYRRRGDTLTFRLNAGVPTVSAAVENVVITLRDAVTVPGTYAIDSISPAEAFGGSGDVVCAPPRPWALWSSRAFSPSLVALSRRGGTLTVSTVDTVPNGLAISGRFEFTGQRTDLYDDPLGALPVRGTFVSPLVTDLTSCR